MLDETNYIAQKDPQDMLGLVLAGIEQLSHQFTAQGGELPARNRIDHIVVLGMGGSALAAEYLKVWPGLDIPFVISRAYEVPPFVGARTLVIASSYSGNTEETLAAMGDAKAKGAQLAVLTSGGKLLERALADNLPHVVLPGGKQPRACVFYNLKALVTMLEQAGFLNGAVAQLESAAQDLARASSGWAASVPTADNAAKQLAEEMMGKTPIIYGGKLFAVAYKWKINCNENAKNLAWCNQLPEFNHNEFMGWTSHPIEKPFVVIDLLSTFDHPQVQKRFIVSDKLLSGKRPEAIQIQAEGETLLEQLLWSTLLGDAVSVYLALLNGVNPTPVDLIEKLKKELAA